MMLESIASIRKAIVAFFTSIVVAGIAAASAGSVELGEQIGAGVASLIAALLVYLTRNVEKPAG